MDTFQNRRILLIDDMPAIHEDFRKILGTAAQRPDNLNALESALFGSTAKAAAETYVLDSAYQGQEGLAMLEAARNAGLPYSVAFVDMRMPPGWDGVETIEHLWRVDARLQVVICTAFSDYSWDEVLERLDVRDRLLILKKPFDAIEVSQLARMLTAKWDTTERAVEQSARLARASRMETVGTMAAGIAHDFNTILGVINGYAELLSDEFPERSPARENLQHIVAASIRAGNLVARMLAFARQQTVEPAEVDAVALVTETVDMLRITLPAGVHMTFNSTPEQASVLASATQIHQIVMNLCRNAIDAMGGKGTLDIGIVRADSTAQSGRLEGPRLCISVQDNGPGMTMELQQRVFDPFFTTKEPGKGSGLGLSVVYGIVADLGGEIRIDSKTGAGARFEVFLPLLEERKPGALRGTPQPNTPEKEESHATDPRR